MAYAPYTASRTAGSRSASCSRSGISKVIPVDLMRFFARTRRCAMVAGSTANAAAMAAASTPSTTCSISGVRMDAAMAGCAHTSISSSLRSGMPQSSGVSGQRIDRLPQSVSSSGTLVLLAADFHVSRSRLRATTSNQASGLSGTPSKWPAGQRPLHGIGQRVLCGRDVAPGGRQERQQPAIRLPNDLGQGVQGWYHPRPGA